MVSLAAWVTIFLLVLLVGGAAVWFLGRRPTNGAGAPPPPGTVELGYGAERWERELALWQGTLRRLEIQARHHSPVPERLQREIEATRARIAEAERHLRD